MPAFCGWADPGSAFTAVVQLGTMAAVLVYFRDDWNRIIRGLLRTLATRRIEESTAVSATPKIRDATTR